MFDIGFWELILIAVLALLVVGPERMPGLLRDIGRWVTAARRFVVETRYEIERELDLDSHANLGKKISDLDDLMEIAPDKKTSTHKD